MKINEIVLYGERGQWNVRSQQVRRFLILQLYLNQKNRYYYSSKPTGTMLYHVSTIFKASIKPLNKVNETVSTSVVNGTSNVLNQANVLKEMNLAKELNQM